MRSRLFRTFKVLLAAVLLIMIIGTAVFVAWASTVPEIMPQAKAALIANEGVEYRAVSGWLAFTPVNQTPPAGYIIYPGGRIPAEAYAPLAQTIAEQGYFVAIVRVPLNLALLDTNVAAAVIQAHPEIKIWAVGGHSLGGVAASQFAKNHPGDVKGLVLMASQAFPGAGLEAANLPVVSLYGTRDGLFTLEHLESSRAELPADTQFIAIEGGNHSQFGWYGTQSGDHPAEISYDDQQAQVVSATLDLLSELSTPQ